MGQFKTETRKLIKIAFHPLFLSFVLLMIAIALVELFRGGIHWRAFRAPAFRATWLLTVYSAAGLLMYSIILVGETYVAVFLLIFSVAWLCGLTLVFPDVLPRRLEGCRTDYDDCICGGVFSRIGTRHWDSLDREPKSSRVGLVRMNREWTRGCALRENCAVTALNQASALH